LVTFYGMSEKAYLFLAFMVLFDLIWCHVIQALMGPLSIIKKYLLFDFLVERLSVSFMIFYFELNFIREYIFYVLTLDTFIQYIVQYTTITTIYGIKFCALV